MFNNDTLIRRTDGNCTLIAFPYFCRCAIRRLALNRSKKIVLTITIGYHLPQEVADTASVVAQASQTVVAITSSPCLPMPFSTPHLK